MKKVTKFIKEQEKELKFFIQDKESNGREVRRAQALLMLQASQSTESIELLTGFEKKYVFRLRKRYLSKGLAGIKDRKKKPRSLLTKGQLEQIRNVLHKNTPRNFGFECDFWTASILAQLIKEQYNVHYKSKTSIYIIFKKSHFTFHKPGAQYERYDQEKVDKWKEEIRPIVKKAVINDKSVVIAADEMILSSQTTFQKIWLPAGGYPKIDVSIQRKRKCIYGFLNIKTGKEHAFKTDRTTGETTCMLLDKIGKIYLGKKILLIWDNASWHRSQLVKKFLRETKHSFKLINFPPYAPDGNPQEHVWKAGRAHLTHNKLITNIEKTSKVFVNYLNETIFDYKFLGF